jgi:hypothetical protein
VENQEKIGFWREEIARLSAELAAHDASIVALRLQDEELPKLDLRPLRDRLHLFRAKVERSAVAEKA